MCDGNMETPNEQVGPLRGGHTGHYDPLRPSPAQPSPGLGLTGRRQLAWRWGHSVAGIRHDSVWICRGHLATANDSAKDGGREQCPGPPSRPPPFPAGASCWQGLVGRSCHGRLGNAACRIHL